jgi:hypothetical protein
MNRKNLTAAILCVLFLLVFVTALAGSIPSLPETVPGAVSAGVALWKGRTFEVLVLGVIILAGVVSILLLLGPDRSRGMEP